MMQDVIAWLELNPLFFAMFIVAARVVDVSLGTMRTIAVVRGHRLLAASLGFAEVIVWVIAVSGVLVDIAWWKVLAYGVGFALGNATGIALEGYLAMGKQMVMLVSNRRQQSVAFALRMNDFRVTEVPGRGGSRRVALCFTLVSRKRVPDVLRIAHEADEDCLSIVEDVRYSYARSGAGFAAGPTGWRAVLKRK